MLIIMEAIWKTLCQIAATFSLGCSMSLIGPFMYQASKHFDHFSYGEFFAYLIGGRGVGMATGVVMGVLVPVKYNYSFLTSLSLLSIAIAAAAVPWLSGSVVLLPTVIGLGFAAGMTKICSQNLFKIYHSHASPSNKLSKLMHISFAFGCFFALTSVFFFSNVSMYPNPYSSSPHGTSIHQAVSFHSSAGPTRRLEKRSLLSEVNASSSDSTVLPTLSTSTPSRASAPFTIKKDLVIETGNSSNNDSSPFFNSSTPISVAERDNATEVLTPSPTVIVTTETPPKKPVLVDANNGQHSKDGASGNKINPQLKENLKNNPLELPAAPPPIPSSSAVTLSPSSTLSETSTRFNVSTTLTVFPDNSTVQNSNFSAKMTVSASSFVQGDLPAPFTIPRDSSHSNSSLKTATIAADDDRLALANLTTKQTLSTLLLTPIASTDKTPHSSITPASVSVTDSLSKSSSYPTTKTTNSDSTTSTELSIDLSSTSRLHGFSSPSFFSSLSTSSVSDRVGGDLKISKTSGRSKVTDLDSLAAIVDGLQFHFQSHALGFFIVSAVVCIASGMFAVNSGICWKSKNVKSFSDISYSCPDRDSIPTRKLTYLRVVISTFTVAYSSAEVIVASLLASYLCSFDGVTLSMGILGSCTFWLWFCLGRLAFAVLSGYIRLYYLAFLSCSLSLFCLIFFHFATIFSFHISWHFLATVLSATGFFFSMVNPSFGEYREAFPVLAYNTNVQEAIVSFGELFIPFIVCSLVFSSGAHHFIYSVVATVAACLFSLIFLRLTNSSSLAKKPARRRNSENSETSWCKNVDEVEVETLSFDCNSSVKPLLNP